MDQAAPPGLPTRAGTWPGWTAATAAEVQGLAARYDLPQLPVLSRGLGLDPAGPTPGR